MGASISKASLSNCQQAITTVTNNAIQTVNSNCSQGITATQNITIGTIENSNNNTFTNQLNIASQLVCIQSDTSSTDFESAITSALSADLTAGASAGTALGLSISDSDISSFSSSISNVANSFDLKTFQSCVNDVLVEQNFTVKNGIYGSNDNTILNSSTVNAVANCTQSSSQLVSAQNSLATDIATKATATSSSGFNLAIIGIIGIVILLLLFGGYKLLTGGIGSIAKGTGSVIKGTVDTAGNI